MLTAYHIKQAESKEVEEHNIHSLSDLKPEATNRAVSDDSYDIVDALETNPPEETPSQVQNKRVIDTVCHELRTSLNGIYGNVNILESITEELEQALVSADRKTIDPKLKALILDKIKLQKEALHTIDICVRHQKVITDDILNFSKLAEGKFELICSPANPKKIIEEVIAILHSDIAKKKLEIYLKLPYEDNIVNIDSNKIRQILLNLVSNAIKFTPQGGEITIALSKPDIDEKHTTLKFSVKDTGLGMTETEKERIFTPYLQANSEISAQYGGSGLGLSISKSLIELMGGKISVQSTKDMGTIFNFNISCSTKIEAKNNPVSPVIFAQLKRTISQNKSVLIVEDNSINQKIVRKYLEQVGYTCAVANNGQEAVELWEHHSFQVVLMDCEMPVMDGFEATQLIREKESCTNDIQPVIIIGLSANVPTERLLKKITKVGMDSYLAKPFDKMKLLETIAIHSCKIDSPVCSRPSAAQVIMRV